MMIRSDSLCTAAEPMQTLPLQSATLALEQSSIGVQAQTTDILNLLSCITMKRL